MAIGAEQREYMRRTLQKAIAKYYGDQVPTLAEYTNRKRKTFAELLKEKVEAPAWLQKIADARHLKGVAQGRVTKLQENYQAKQAELRQQHDLEAQQLRAKQQKELNELTAHYETPTAEAKQLLRERDSELVAVTRASYFAGLQAEDDGRHLYNERNVESAVEERVNLYIENNLTQDEDGLAVQKRINEETLIADATYIANNLKELRETVLKFIDNGKLPAITVEAWLIENGKDLSEVG